MANLITFVVTKSTHYAKFKDSHNLAAYPVIPSSIRPSANAARIASSRLSRLRAALGDWLRGWQYGQRFAIGAWPHGSGTTSTLTGLRPRASRNQFGAGRLPVATAHTKPRLTSRPAEADNSAAALRYEPVCRLSKKRASWASVGVFDVLVMFCHKIKI